MIWHNNVSVYRYIFVEIIELIDYFVGNLSVRCEFYERTVREACPYNVREYAPSVLRANCDKICTCTVVIEPL